MNLVSIGLKNSFSENFKCKKIGIFITDINKLIILI